MAEDNASKLVPQSSGSELWIQEYDTDTGEPTQYWEMTRFDMFNHGLACLGLAVEGGVTLADFIEDEQPEDVVKVIHQNDIRNHPSNVVNIYDDE